MKIQHKTIFAILISSLSMYAQFLPTTGDKQVVFGVTGNGAMLMLRKFKSETINNRYGIGLSYNISPNQRTENQNGILNKNLNTFFQGSFSFGKQKNFNLSDKFAPYIALDASIGFNTYNNSSNSILEDTSAYNSLYNKNSSRRQVTLTRDSKSTSLNMRLALTPVIGFNYYFAKNFALGAECMLNFLNFDYTVFSESSYTSSGSYTEYLTDPNTGISSKTLIIENSPTPSISKSSGFNINGRINPTVFVCVSYYFK